jgi:hypothetical protein
LPVFRRGRPIRFVVGICDHAPIAINEKTA